MMISPTSFIDNCKDDSLEDLIQEREALLMEIRQLEEIVFDKDKKGDEWNFCPGPEVRYQVKLEYLSELCLYIKERYSKEYVWGDVE